MHLGRYELISRLARGGMGEVYLARRRGPGDIEKRVVIKRIRRELSGDPRFVDMFLSEARVSMTLSHKNIVPVFDFGRAGTELFLAMEYVRGRDLARALRAAGDERRLSPTAVAHLGIEVCRALDYAHHRDDGDPIIHRDLSPKNLLLSFAGEVVVADFGLAISATDDLARTGVRGTPAYLSPEQARGEAVDGRSDLYSLGLVLREMLTGQRGHGDGAIAELIERARSGELEPLSREVPERLADVIAIATRADREERFGSARDMQLALDDFLIAGRAAGAEPPGHELADWLTALFPEPEVRGVELDSDDDVDAVTFLDDGVDAVTQEARRLGDSTAASIAETVGDLDEPSAASAAEPATSTAREIAPPRTSPVWIAATAAALTAAIGGGILWLTRDEPKAAAPADARATAPPPIDAAPPPPVDAPPPPVDAAPPPPIDAAPPPEPDPGTLVVSTSRGWAAVRVLGANKRCAETPCRFTLRPGRYTVELSNPVRGTKTRKQVTIKSRRTARLVVSL